MSTCCSISLLVRSAHFFLDIGAKLAKLSYNIIISTLDLVDAFNDGGVFSCESRDYHSRACAEIVTDERCAREGSATANYCMIGVNLNVCAHLRQLIHKLESAIEYVFYDVRGSFCEAEHSRELRLHIGSESGIRLGVDADALELAGAFNGDVVVSHDNCRACLFKLCGDCFHVLGNDVSYGNLTACCGNCCHIGSCFDHIGNDRVTATVELFNALDLDHGSSCAGDVRTARVEEYCEVYDMGLASRVVDNGHAVSENGCEDSVSCCTYGNLVEVNGVADCTAVFALNLESAVLVVAVSAESLECLHVKVEWTGADAASAGVGNTGSCKATELCAEQIGRSADLGCKLVRGGAGNKVLAVDLYRVFGESVYVCTHGCQKIEKGLDVAYRRDIIDDAGLLVENACANNGKCCVFHTVDRNAAVKGMSAVNDDLLHDCPPCIPPVFCGCFIFDDVRVFVAHAVERCIILLSVDVFIISLSCIKVNIIFAYLIFCLQI